VTHDNIIILK